MDAYLIGFLSIQFPNETARHKRAFLLFSLHFVFHIQHAQFLLSSVLCPWYLYYKAKALLPRPGQKKHWKRERYGGWENRSCRRLILLLRFISLETNCPTKGRTFCETSKNFWPLKCPCPGFYVCVSMSVSVCLVLHSVVGLCDKFFI